MSIQPITDHVEQATAKFLEQYKNKVRLAGLLEAFIDQIQDLENAILDMENKVGIDTAEGVQQDRNGVIVGIERTAGQSDEDYLLAIKAKIIQNLNQGTPEEIIAAAKFFIGSTLVWYLEVYPAAVDIFSSTSIPEASRAKIRAQLQKFLPAGVSLDSFGHYDETNPLVFSGGRGFGDVNDSTAGGLFADLY